MLRITRFGFVLVLFAGFLAAGCAANQGEMNPSEDAVADDAMDHDGMDHGAMDGHATNGQEGKVCGGIQGLPCDEGQFCEFEPGNCQSADLQGSCVAIPEICTKEYRPVCGCDGKTYGNDCTRRAAAVQKDHDGEC